MEIKAKIFSNCHYAGAKELQCEECSQYQECCVEREKRKKERLKLLNMRRHAFGITVLCVLLAVALVISICMNAKISGNGDPISDTDAKAELSAYGPSKDYYYNISDEEKVIMAKLVFAESGFEPFEGQVAIAAVVLNRYSSYVPYFHKESITAVITQPYQFASIEGITMQMLEDNPSCMEAVEAACKGWDPTRIKFPEGALYFYAPNLMPDDFQQGVEVLKIGKVNFHYDYAS